MFSRRTFYNDSAPEKIRLIVSVYICSSNNCEPRKRSWCVDLGGQCRVIGLLATWQLVATSGWLTRNHMIRSPSKLVVFWLHFCPLPATLPLSLLWGIKQLKYNFYSNTWLADIWQTILLTKCCSINRELGVIRYFPLIIWTISEPLWAERECDTLLSARQLLLCLTRSAVCPTFVLGRCVLRKHNLTLELVCICLRNVIGVI